ncbi:hypothetical protein GP486_008239 [Trichoglossum hirsutum]|uniref:Deacetylase sirtuin-type domain-containing protein n=1 Tax=Trichoglossum hirsutum TaxID=265104 RepID=A0A9P8IEC5_9PEZI|nr:hypothetical protein GP486_008239 [Trichoglossum hirsutum]
MPTVQVGADDNRQLQDVADALAGSRKVVVFTGAGISTSIGIPDFRSENGLYSLIQARYEEAAQRGTPTPASTRSGTPSTALESEDGACSQASSASSVSCGRSSLPLNIKGRDLFDSLVWTNPLSTTIFYTFIASLRKKIKEEVRDTTLTHKFIRTLRDGGRLVRCYTQNIDGLEAREGLCLDIKRGKGSRSRFAKRVVSKPRPNGPTLPGSEVDGGCEVVQLHGDLEALRCGLCSALCSWEDGNCESILLGGRAPECHSCASKDENRRFSGKRGTPVGGLRPNIVLYGEEHPSADLLSPITTYDLNLGPDILIILGTSLRVHGLKVMVREFAKAVHARRGRKVILVNRTKPAESVWSNFIDYWISMDCDEWVADLRQRRGDLWERQGALDLPVTKVARPKAVKSKKEKSTRGTVPVSGKENTVYKNKKAAPKKADTAKKRPEKKVVDAKPGQKATKARLQRPREGLPRPVTVQVFTPSLGDSEAVQSIRPSKRRILNISDEDFLHSNPPKRKKGRVQVWVDCDVKTGHSGRNEMVFVELPLKGKKHTIKKPLQIGNQVEEVVA